MTTAITQTGSSRGAGIRLSENVVAARNRMTNVNSFRISVPTVDRAIDSQVAGTGNIGRGMRAIH
jgi:hypothetical protein